MLVPTLTVKTPSSSRLVKLWAERYTVNLSSFWKPSVYSELVAAISPQGRTDTAASLEGHLLDRCQMAAVQANFLHEYIPHVVDLKEAMRLTQMAHQVYKKLLEIYQQETSDGKTPTGILAVGSSERIALTQWGIPNIEKLATEIEPVLLEFQQQHTASRDWRTLGFITTQINFSNKLLLQQLTSVEQVLLGPYFKFVEEQVALPWQRVCTAAAEHQLDSPALTLVEQMLPTAPQIADTVYRQLAQLFPFHQSRRGRLSHPDVMHSCLRDLQMFQAYLWLCVLESSMTSVEQELVDLCIMVMPTVGVKWEVTAQWSQLLTDEMSHCLPPSQRQLLLPYTQGLQEAFLKARPHFRF